MKKILYFLLAGIIFTAIIWACEKNAQENKSQHVSGSTKLKQRSDDFCFDSTNCTKISTAAVQLLYVPGYSPCEIYATYDLWACDIFTIAHSYTITNFKLTLTDGYDSLKTRWDSLDAAANYALETAEMDAFYFAAKLALERYIVGQYFGYTSHRDSFPCSGGNQNQYFQTDFYSALCYIWCNITTGSPPHQQTALTQEVCGTACCRKQTLWCWDGAHYVQENDATYSNYGSCGTTTVGPCYGGRMVGSCNSHTCNP